MILLALLSILLLSNLITALSTFFLAKDLDLLVAAPVGGARLYLAKLGETVVHSSWMVALLLAARSSPRTASCIRAGRCSRSSRWPRSFRSWSFRRSSASIITLFLVNVFPARRTRELLGLLGAGRAGDAW